MAYVIAEPCIDTKDNSCVEVCPVDCIHPTPDEPDYDKVEMLFIDPDECIDCDACVEACPVDACFAEDQLPEEWASYAQKNAEYYAGQGWPGRAAPAPSGGGGPAGLEPRRDLGHRQRHPRRLGSRRGGGRLHDGQLDRRERHEPAGGLPDRLGRGLVRVGEHERV